MRIAVVSPSVDRSHGTERAVAELVERLARDFGCEVHLYAQRVEDLAVSDTRVESDSGSGRIVWHRVPSVPGPHLVQFLAWLILNSAMRRWHSFRRGSGFDVVLTPGINCLHPDFVIVHVLFQRLRELSRDKDASKQVGFVRRIHRRVYYTVLSALERRVYCDSRVSLVAVSSRTAALLEKHFRRANVPIVPNGVDAAHFSPPNRLARRAESRRQFGIHDDDIVLLLIGNDWRVKGLPTVLEALAGLRDLPLRLVVVGSDAAAPFQAQARTLGVFDRCVWEQPRADALDFYAASDVYVSPTLEDSFGLPVAEAMSCGLPVISSQLAGVAEFLQSGINGFVVSDPRDPQNVVEFIRRLYDDSDFRKGVGESAAETIAACTWENHAAGIFSLLKAARETKIARGERPINPS